MTRQIRAFGALRTNLETKQPGEEHAGQVPALQLTAADRSELS
jgi:hypothetical protein